MGELGERLNFYLCQESMPCYSPKAPTPRANGSNPTALESVDFRCAPEAVCTMQV